MQNPPQQRRAVILGATGLVGNACLNRLLNLDEYLKVTALVRKKLPLSHPKLEQVVVDFDRLEKYADRLQGDDLFCCLGTTIKKAGSKGEFSKVDLGYPSRAGTIASQNGMKRFLLVTSVGASPGAKNFYLRTKGELEVAISKLGFSEIHIFRPSLLLGERMERRLLEAASIALAKRAQFIFKGRLGKYRPVAPDHVAGAMVRAALGASAPGVHVHEGFV